MRFYDRIGLLKPYFIHPDTQYRYYHIDQFMALDLIIAARAIHISPNTLVPYFVGKDSENLTRLLVGQKDKIIAEIDKLKKALASIDNLKAVLAHAHTSIKKEGVYTRRIPSRNVLMRPYNAESFEKLIVSYSLIDTQIMQSGLTNSYEAGAYCVLSEKGIIPEYIYCAISEKAEKHHAYRVIEKGRYLCIVATKDNANQQATKLYEHITEKGLEPQFFVQTELMTDLFTGSQTYFEFQVKIRE